MNSRECHLKEDVRLYHWNSHISLYEVQLKPAQEDLPDWSRVTELQVVFSLEIDRTTEDGSVAGSAGGSVGEVSAASGKDVSSEALLVL